MTFNKNKKEYLYMSKEWSQVNLTNLFQLLSKPNCK